MAADFATFLTFRELGGVAVTTEEVARELSRLPLDGVLGLLASISLAGTQAGEQFFDPRWQGAYLKAAIVDDFPRPLPRAATMYMPGRVPMTGGKHVFIHEQNMAWLAHEALLHCQRGMDTPELSPSLQQRVCRLLLVANDVLSPLEITAAPRSLTRARDVALNLVRHSQFNLFFRPMPVTLLRLARQRVLFIDLLPNHFPIREAFLVASGGVSIEHYFEILGLFATHVDQGMRGSGNHWIRRDRLIQDVRAAQHEIALVFDRWIRTPEEHEEAWRRWASARPDAMTQPGFDYIPLRQAPLVEARLGEVVCPVLPLLLAKATDEPYFLVCDSLDENDRRRFQEALGRAYEEYAHSLVERIAKKDCAGPWSVIAKPYHPRHGELADSMLLRGGVAVHLEHKGGRPGTEFICGGEGARVLGPESDLLKRLDAGEVIAPGEGKKRDNGVFTRPLWQQSRAGRHLASWAKREHGADIRTMYGLITHAADLRVASSVRRVYLDRLNSAANLYRDNFWAGLEWLHVEDLESLTRLAEDGRLDLHQLLEKKRGHAALRFDYFLFQEFGSLPGPDERLRSTVLQLLKGGARTFFLEEIGD